MKRTLHSSWRLARGGFTLIEILLAITLFATIMGAIYSAMHVALQLQTHAEALVAKGEGTRQAMNLIRHDIENMVVPNGLMEGAMNGASNSDGGYRHDTIDFFATDGIITDSAPWGDIQEVKYYLNVDSSTVNGSVGSTNMTNSIGLGDLTTGKVLLRSVTRNLLPTEVQEAPPEQAVLPHIESFELQYYDGQTWQDDWDSTTYNNAAPLAVHVYITFQRQKDQRVADPPIDMVIPIAVGDLDTINGNTDTTGATAGASTGSTGSSTGGSSTSGGSTSGRTSGRTSGSTSGFGSTGGFGGTSRSSAGGR